MDGKGSTAITSAALPLPAVAGQTKWFTPDVALSPLPPLPMPPPPSKTKSKPPAVTKKPVKPASVKAANTATAPSTTTLTFSTKDDVEGLMLGLVDSAVVSCGLVTCGIRKKQYLRSIDVKSKKSGVVFRVMLRWDTEVANETRFYHEDGTHYMACLEDLNGIHALLEFDGLAKPFAVGTRSGKTLVFHSITSVRCDAFPAIAALSSTLRKTIIGAKVCCHAFSDKELRIVFATPSGICYDVVFDAELYNPIRFGASHEPGDEIQPFRQRSHVFDPKEKSKVAWIEDGWNAVVSAPSLGVVVETADGGTYYSFYGVKSCSELTASHRHAKVGGKRKAEAPLTNKRDAPVH